MHLASHLDSSPCTSFIFSLSFSRERSPHHPPTTITTTTFVSQPTVLLNAPLRSLPQVRAAVVTHVEVVPEAQQAPATPAVAPAAPAPPAPAAPQMVSAVAPPPIVFQKVVEAGVAKANLPWEKIALLGLLAGCYIGMGAFLSLSVGGCCPGLAATNPGLQKILSGAFGLPFGLTLVLVCGAELYTGNTALVTAAWLEKKATLQQLAKSWSVSLVANIVGSLLLVGILSQTGLLATVPGPVNAALAKTSLTFGEAFFRGLMCNWLVCLAIVQSLSATSLPGKFIGVFLPISTFVACGFEHSVANAFIIPFGMALGANVSWSQFLLGNLLPVTLGNTVAGALFVAGMYALVYGKMGEKKAVVAA